MQRKLISLLIACTVAGIASPAYSLDDKAVLKRLDQLEAQRKADQAEISSLRSKVQQLETQKSGAVSSTEATELREEIVKVDKKATSRLESTKKAIETERDKLKVNGYLSAYATKTTNQAVTLGAKADNHIGFAPDTIAAVQFDYKIDDLTNAVVQLRAQGRDGYDVDASWAFLRYKLTPSTTVRAGRMVVPLYLYADSLDVGFTYPWVRPPIEMYSTASPLFDGLDLIQSFNFGNWTNSLQLVYGDGDQHGAAANGNAITTKYIAGAALTFNNASWTLRGAAFRFDDFNLPVTALIPGGLAGPGPVDYYSASLRYDDGKLLVLAEGRKLAVSEGIEAIVPDSEGFYTTIGYQIDKFMPYATWAKEYSTHEQTVFFGSRESVESVGLGLRYSLSDKVALKGEATKYSNFNGTGGAATMTDPALLTPARRERLDDDGATVMSLGVDAVF